MVRRFGHPLRPPTPIPRLALGRRAESLAVHYLKRRGFVLLHRNWRCRAGEIDLILREGDSLVFVEVKSRAAYRDDGRYLFENVDFRKKQRLRLLAEIYLAYYYSRRPRPSVRIDVVGILLDPSGRKLHRIEHFRAAV